jgi:transposase, IS30 family
MVTLVERHSRYLLVLPLRDATTRTVVAAVTVAFKQLPPTMGRSLIWDRGVEMMRHADFTATTGIPVYFCDAYYPWQRGIDENSNGLLRQYFPTCIGSAMSWSGQLPVACR